MNTPTTNPVEPPDEDHPQDWMVRAACRAPEVNPDWFHPDLREGERSRRAQKALQICSTCPVIDQCLALALLKRDAWGIFGGTLPSERGVKALERFRPRQVA